MAFLNNSLLLSVITKLLALSRETRQPFTQKQHLQMSFSLSYATCLIFRVDLANFSWHNKPLRVPKIGAMRKMLF